MVRTRVQFILRGRGMFVISGRGTRMGRGRLALIEVSAEPEL